jgi:ribosomal protein S18 acetylase RimI-like enzyme
MACELKNFVLLPSKKLKKLSLSSNEIVTLPESIGEYTELVELDLESNELENLPDSLANLTQLSTLYIGSNPLTQEAKNVIKVLHPEICDIHMKTGIEIVKATESDFETMANLLALLFAIESDFEINFEKQYAGIAALHKDDRSDLLVAKDGDKVVGMITMQRLISSAEGSFVGQIEDLVVDDAYRKMGIGSRLINKMRSLATQYGYKRIQLAADIENKNALAFYNRRGFKKTHLNVYHYNV